MAADQPAKRQRVPPIMVLGIGNPLLDISAAVDDAFLDKYGIRMGNAILAEEKHMGIYDDLASKEDVEYIAGGSTLNSIRVCQWMAQRANFTGYIGSIANDKYGTILRDQAQKDGVQTNFFYAKDVPTGTCATCIKERERSLVANLSAANKYEQAHINENISQQMVKSARIIYSAGFFLTVSPETIVQLGQSCAERDAIFAVNLSAEFIIQFFGDKLATAMEWADFVFGNETEATKYAEVNKLEDTSIAGVAKAIANLPSRRKRARTVVITQGSERTVVCSEDEIYEFPVPSLDSKLIVDLNGAGDAFVGGFLSQLILGKQLKKCVDAAHYAAQSIIQVSGTKLETKPTYKGK